MSENEKPQDLNTQSGVVELKDLFETEETIDPKTEAEQEFEKALMGGEDKKDYLDLQPKEEVVAETNDESKEKVVQEEKTIVYNNDSLKQTLVNLFGDKVSTILQENEQGETVEVALQDLDVDEEVFEEIVKLTIDSIKEEASQDKISVKGVSNFTKELIEIDRNGGDISKLLEVKQVYSDPLDNLDLSTIAGQKEAVFLKEKAHGREDEDIIRLIRSFEQEGVLEEKAEQSEKMLRDVIKKQVEVARLQSQKEKEERESLMKDYKKEIREYLNKFELTDIVKNKLAVLATKEEKGKFEMDKKYFERRSSPEQAARLALFLEDEDLYVKLMTSKAVTETKLNTAKKLKLASKNSQGIENRSERTNREVDKTVDISVLE